MSETTADADTRPARPAGRGRRPLKIAAAIVVAVAVIIWLAFWLYHRWTHVSGNDARVATHEITVSSRLDGRVTDFSLIQGDRLAAGQRVARLYSRPQRLQRRELAARVDRMQAQLAGQKTRIALARRKISGGTEQSQDTLAADQAAMQAAHARMDKAQHDAERSQALFERHGVSRAERDADRYAYRSARAEYARAQRQVGIDRIALANARTGMLTTPSTTVDNPRVLENQRAVMKDQLAEARAALAHQDNEIDDLSVAAPIAGVVDQTFIEPGEYVSAGQPVIMMHDPHNVWIEAKIKETKIASLKRGQPVAIEVDARPDTRYRGHVQRIGHAATNQFALLPNPNPSGNFTKITQRIPVRIAIDHGPRTELAPGMMVEVDIDTSAAVHESGSAPAPHAQARDHRANERFGRLATEMRGDR